MFDGPCTIHELPHTDKDFGSTIVILLNSVVSLDTILYM